LPLFLNVSHLFQKASWEFSSHSYGVNVSEVFYDVSLIASATLIHHCLCHTCFSHQNWRLLEYRQHISITSRNTEPSSTEINDHISVTHMGL
jgi:hypothetical protein